MKRALFAFLAAGLAAHPMLAQPPGLTGRVVADETRVPIQNTRVALDAPGDYERSVVLTDRDGRFHLPAAPGRHTIVATKTGFARGAVIAGAGGVQAEIRLRRGGAISGRVVDQGGEPVVAAQVTVEAHADSPTRKAGGRPVALL